MTSKSTPKASQAKAPKPATTEDAQAAAAQATEQAKAKAATKAKAKAPKVDTRPVRYVEAIAVKRAEGKRGPGTKVTDEELVAWIEAEKARSAGITGRQAVEVAYWIERFAVSASRVEALWADPTQAKATPAPKAEKAPKAAKAEQAAA